ncbi:hypothetical protein C1645_842434 [Glomus cerebriforme]|uniref:Uncharacterized protein n=1 Tax=Glomus cerebriforme TaxID=658196 RepID=A0A397S458_9GLOM|nr:hypothetical protein C1645_842434 [Glomus cerebriforme]
MRNVHTLKDISSGHRLGSAREMELEKMLRNSIQSISELTNEYNDMQGAKDDLSSKEYELECLEKGVEEKDNIYKRALDSSSSARLNLTEENSRLCEIISKKDNEIADLSNPPPPPMDDSSQKLPGWLSDDLRPLVYGCGLEDKVMKLDKEYAKEDILEALQELLPQDGVVSRSQTDTLPNQSIHSQPAHSEKSISREGVAKQSGGAEVVPLSQEMPLAPATVPVVTSFLMSSMLIYSILTIVLIAIIWIVGRKWWNSWSAKPKEKSNTEPEVRR